MVDIRQAPMGGGDGGSGNARDNPAAPFVLDGDVTFAPFFFPDRVQVTKQREKQRTSGFCGGENVSDKGAKNREIHVTGKASGQFEREALDEIANHGGELDLSSAAWSGEVQVKEVEYEGPTGWHPPTSSLYWDYRIDLISTGLDEPEDFTEIEQIDVLREDY